MGLKHTTIKAAGQKLFAVADWNADHVADGVVVPNLNADMLDGHHYVAPIVYLLRDGSNANQDIHIAPGWSFYADGLYGGNIFATGRVEAPLLKSTDDITATNDITAGGRFFGSDGSLASPTYSFASHTSAGMYASYLYLSFSQQGHQMMQIRGTKINLYGDLDMNDQPIYGTTYIRPENDNAYDLGSTSLQYKDLYLGGKIDLGTNTIVDADVGNWNTHIADNSQAHSDYLINNGDDSTSGTLTAAGFISTGDIHTTGSGDDLWLGNAAQGSAKFRAYASGNLVAHGAAQLGNLKLSDGMGFKFSEGYALNVLAIQGQETNRDPLFALYPYDDDGSDYTRITLNSIGPPNQYTNRQMLSLHSGTTATGVCSLYTFASGTGVVPNLNIYTWENSNQLYLKNDGNVGIGTTPATSGALDISSTTGALIVPRMTTVQMNALTAINGMIIYDITLTKFMFYENGTWQEAVSGGASQLSDLSDVGVTTPTNRNVLVADGDSWESREIVEADVSDFGSYIETTHPANNITPQDITDIGNLSGTNTGDQSLTGLVPYTGATGNLDLGTHNIITASLEIKDEYTLPIADGSDGQVLTSDGAGAIGWETPIVYTEQTYHELNDGSPNYDLISISPGAHATWTSIDLTAYGIDEGDVVELAFTNNHDTYTRHAGARTVDSNTDRASPLRVWATLTEHVVVGTGDCIEIYEEDDDRITTQILGYWH